jgi:hypothetical protein
MAAPPPPMCDRLERSNRSKLGLPIRSITMVGMLVQVVTRQREISQPASSRSQRGISTIVAPAKTLACITLTMPVMWNIGTTSSETAPAVALPQAQAATALCMALRCGCMQPLGLPVVPLV